MWIYKQATGELLSGEKVVAKGYAGHGEGVNNPAMQSVPKTGPLPRGLYTIQAPHDSDHVGKYAMDLAPDAANEMFGRSLFRCHGDNSLGNKSASEGCIVLPRVIREQIWESGDHRLEVI